MSDPLSTPPPAPAGLLEPGADNAQLIYILYLVGFITGITVLIGLVLAYLNRGKAGGFVESHYTWLIRTFWIGLLYSLVGAVLSLALIGFLVLLATAVWAIVRLVKGLQALGRREAMPDPQSWWI